MSGGAEKARVLMMLPFATNEVSKPGKQPGLAPRCRNEPEPTLAQITKAVAFLCEALKAGPRLTREVEREAKQQGHAKRTLDRARSQLHVKKIPPVVFGGPWQIALPGDPVVQAYQQRKDAKNQRARERQGNGRRQKRNGNGGKHRNKLLAPIR